ncbi:1-acyl-sn-glycerol-3-phosphate acyltransferase [Hazenella sp. IB182357]|uniref:1-acyl-sn-glycerol-3-phosphate acyltransferase n=1 Tax=Polycladospora coralii TaxID=2771432 RepID=A0A926NGX2_9BACL|nr:lysophospholipid acyltransferase family protein [Polycladospora coralii]MBD1373128.1 1-acyl-sn-glycerol-3-phosphate acyltransferase [Polycladospora coralii]MBS7531686.1 1-acyl-sn-glycerol-3-phosphate acyltransferase [Polycladospora coralii]
MQLYPIAKGIVRSFLSLYHRVDIIGRKRVPTEGGLVIIGNHISNLDPVYIGGACPRPVHYMAKQELFNHSGLAKLIRALGAFPVNREKPSIKTIKTAIQYLKDGEVIGLFPEGARKGSAEELGELKQGAAYFAVKANCPVLPFFISGSEAALPKGKLFIRPTKVTIEIGEPIYPPQDMKTSEQQTYISQEIMNQLRNFRVKNS